MANMKVVCPRCKGSGWLGSPGVQWNCDVCYGDKTIMVNPMVAEPLVRTGVVKWFNDAKGFGFITPDDKSEDLYAHHAEIDCDGFRSIAEGQRVEFLTHRGPKGLTARRIRVIPPKKKKELCNDCKQLLLEMAGKK